MHLKCSLVMYMKELGYNRVMVIESLFSRIIVTARSSDRSFVVKLYLNKGTV